MDWSPTKLLYYDHMFLLQSSATLLSFFKGDDGRRALILDSTIFHPKVVVFHYGFIENSNEELESKLEKGKEVSLHVDESRRKLNSSPSLGSELVVGLFRVVGFVTAIITKANRDNIGLSHVTSRS
ncbi:hypothetical protein CK203_115514 [Vitis vinifera]|uniref:Uncharacterized protein n=1 Tax=Vitis vinifera TaxID=29760 RepID=A0A438F7A7_VITVI|nr:hypothetical protein CK203_115514 [Vitis vinifera]